MGLKDMTDAELRDQRKRLQEDLDRTKEELQARAPKRQPGSQVQMGGSFNPAITEATLNEYVTLWSDASPEVADAIEKLIDMMEAYLGHNGVSSEPGKPHPSETGMIVPMSADKVKALGPVVPWLHECEMYRLLFETLPQGKLRYAAFHLLWYAYELTRDREPITKEAVLASTGG